MRPLLTAMVLCLLLLLGTRVAFAHPKPGAHADVRLSVDKDAVRVNVLMNVLFADQVVRVPRRDESVISETEAAAYTAALTEYFGGPRSGPITALYDRANSVRIDGFAVAPLVKKVNVIIPEPETRPGFVQNPALLLPQIHIELEYPCKSEPNAVAFVWGAFPRDFIANDRDLAPLSPIEAVLVAFGKLEIVTFTKAEPEYTWHAPAGGAGPRLQAAPKAPIASKGISPAWIALPLSAWAAFSLASLRSGPRRAPRLWLGTAAAGVATAAILTSPAWLTRPTPRLSATELLDVFKPLHANIYRAFDYTNEGEIYDALAQSIDGPLLDQVYGDVYRSLILQEEGGALCRVKAVDLIETEVIPPADADAPQLVRCSWKVEGVVYHWGHSHSRTSEYQADYALSPRPEGWRIVAVKPLSHERISPAEQAASEAKQAQPGSTWSPNR
ncbi:MAG: hypothetical protein ACOYN0_09715 [Phycisphaerales bacterium]